MLKIINPHTYEHIQPAYALTTDDILLVPEMGKVESRSKIERQSFLINAPMIASSSYPLLLNALEHNEYFAVVRAGEFGSLGSIESLIAFINKISKESSPVANWAAEKLFFAIGLEDSRRLSILTEDTEIPINVIVDIAHGYNLEALEFYKELSETRYINNIMSGSIATEEAALQVKNAGCTHARVGIGNGSACTTRDSTGVGISQLTAVMNCAKISDIHIVADGNVERVQDAAKYIAAGASLVMSGKQFAYTRESGGWNESFTKKIYFGHASSLYKQVQKLDESYIEGDSYTITNALPVKDLYRRFYEGVASTCSYVGVKSIKELRDETIFAVLTSPNSLKENGIRGNNGTAA